jgi:hypothetical protein
MPHRTKDLQAEILRLNRIIAQIEMKPPQERAAWSATLADLHAERATLDRRIALRRREASKPVVDFSVWREDGGAAAAFGLRRRPAGPGPRQAR